MTKSPPTNGLDRYAPLLFVVLWSTGFLAGKAGVQDAGPMHFLFIRFLIVSLLFALVTVFTRAPWPKTSEAAMHIMIAGLLVHAAYLGGVFSALRQGISAGQIAMIVGLQPILTAIFAAQLLKERVTAKRWGGLVIGLMGILLVIVPKLPQDALIPRIDSGLPAAVFALFAITLGTLYQKRFCADMDLRSGGVLQFAACALVLPFFFDASDPAPHWTVRFIVSLAWLVLVLSVGAIGLLYRLLRRGAASQVASYFYLVPPVTVIFGVVLLGEPLTPSAILGAVLVTLGVALAR